MTRPTRIELLSKFFPEIRRKSTGGEKEASIRINALACEAILADLISKYDAGLAKHGRGTLCLRLSGESQATYVSREDWEHDRDASAAIGNSGLNAFFAATLEAIDKFNPDKAALLMLIDTSGAQLFPVSREFPAQAIQAMLEEFAE